jgi:gas vesicle structural protein
MDQSTELDQLDLTLLDLVDHVLNKGVVLMGEATISVAGIDLIYLGLNVVLAAVETIEAAIEQPAGGPERPA